MDQDVQNPKSAVSFYAMLGVFICIALGFLYWVLFAAPGHSTETETFIINERTNAVLVARELKGKGLIKNEFGFRVALAVQGDVITLGGFRLSSSMSAWSLTHALVGTPYMRWVTIPEGKRKEEIANILAVALGWNDTQKKSWIDIDTAPDADHAEGVYFPDTYLIPRNETPAQVAQRLRTHFEEKFAPYAKEAAAQNIKWTTVIKIASLLEREAAGPSDMPLVSGIIWNRLLMGMKLDIDATLQYIRGKEGSWWPAVTTNDKTIDSPYNTYKYAGLPPTPIDSPGITAIKATLFPEKTSCLFYLHDPLGAIHCSPTYEGHLKNIDLYLR